MPHMLADRHVAWSVLVFCIMYEIGRAESGDRGGDLAETTVDFHEVYPPGGIKF